MVKLAMFVKELYQTVLPDFKHLHEKEPTCNGKKIPVPYGSLEMGLTIWLLVQRACVTQVPKIHFFMYMGMGLRNYM